MADSSRCPYDTLVLSRTDPLAPPPSYRQLRQEAPRRIELADGSRPWLFTRHEDVRAVLADPAFSADDFDPHFPSIVPVSQSPGALSFIRMDEPEHGRLRRMLTAEFTVRRTAALRPAIGAIIDELLTDLAGRDQPADLVDVFALPFPSLVICRLLGVPYADHEFFQRHSRTIVSVTAGPAATAAALVALSTYLDGLIAEKSREPADDLLSRVAAAQIDAGALSRAELVSMARLLLIAGHETTANQYGLSVLLLLRRPDQLAALRADPGLWRGAVDELLRYLSVVHTSMVRFALRPTSVGGVRVEPGEGAVLLLPAANHDETAFDEAAGFDVRRNPRHHVAFGYGVHQCIGQTLARVELELALRATFDRFPGLRLAVAPEELEFRAETIVYGLAALPVRWS